MKKCVAIRVYALFCRLRPGDIFCHCYQGAGDPICSEEGVIDPGVLADIAIFEKKEKRYIQKDFCEAFSALWTICRILCFFVFCGIL